MSVLTYGPIRGVIQSTEHFGFRPIYSEDGRDYLFTEIDLACQWVVNEEALATVGPSHQAGGGIVLGGLPGRGPLLEDAPPPGVVGGDRLGVSLQNLRAMLLTPRQTLTFSIGGDVTVAAGPTTDANNGPLPQPDTCVRKIMGTATALIYFHIKCWLTDWYPLDPPNDSQRRSRVVLSNRFRVGTTMDEDYWTTRHISGQMVVDTGRLAAKNGVGILSPDAFRQSAFLQIPVGFKRDNVQVTVSSDNSRLDYSYTDTETPLAIGGRAKATRIEGNCTAGYESPIRSLLGTARMAGRGARGALEILGALAGGPLGLLTLTQPAIEDVESILPKLKANGIVRVWGMRDANKADLMRLALNILSDRFRPIAGPFFGLLGAQPFIMSLYVTQDLAERFVEVRAELMPTLKAIAGVQLDNPATSITGQMNLATTIQTGGAQAAPDPLLGDGTGLNPPPPNGNGTRGNWLGALVTALLATPGELPKLPADPARQVDQAAFI